MIFYRKNYPLQHTSQYPSSPCKTDTSKTGTPVMALRSWVGPGFKSQLCCVALCKSFNLSESQISHLDGGHNIHFMV